MGASRSDASSRCKCQVHVHESKEFLVTTRSSLQRQQQVPALVWRSCSPAPLSHYGTNADHVPHTPPVTNKKPTQASITKVKQFEGSTSFVRRSQWMLEQLRQVNGIDPNRDSAEFDLLFENAFDQWVASTASEKCTFFQILHHTCQRYLTDRKPEFINCQSKIMGGMESVKELLREMDEDYSPLRSRACTDAPLRNSILHSAADSVSSAVQKASQALNERGERLGRAEEKTEDLKNSAQQFAETAHKLAMKHKC
ncbi:Syntaxin-binding protein 6 [Myotis davidii]|uniref:Syntaxin-binding protein 6 n=1 Tax=Myotis davidii TaxID=225400 RepID=L5M4L6_MYODS|nr:Syntaxin-binding protein 6 [Myotis davidii]